jgi:hypothetical protein
MSGYDRSHIVTEYLSALDNELAAIVHMPHSPDHSFYAQASHIGYLLPGEIYFT